MRKNISFCYGYDSDYRTRVKLIKQVGFDGVMSLYKKEKDFFPAMDYVLESGLIIDSIHMPFEGIVNDLWTEGEGGEHFVEVMLEGADYASKLGVQKLIVHISSSPCPPPMSKIGFDRLMKIADYYQEKGCVACIENLRRMDYFEEVMNKVSPLGAKICYDVGHKNIYYPDYDMTIYKKDIVTLHLHDNFGLKDQHYLPFEGTIDWDKVASEIKEMPCVDALTIETHGSAKGIMEESLFLSTAMEKAVEIEKRIMK